MGAIHDGRRQNLYQKGIKVKTSEVLNKAADGLEEHGWTHGTAGMNVGAVPHCIQGAIQAAVGAATFRSLSGGIERYRYLADLPCPAGEAVREYLAMPSLDHLWMWNDDLPDHVAKTRVIEVLRACAVIEAAREDQEAAELTYAENLAARR